MVIDNIQISTKQSNSMQPIITKREVLAVTMTKFDSLGWLTPSIIMKSFVKKVDSRMRKCQMKKSNVGKK